MHTTELNLRLDQAIHRYGENAGALTPASRHHLATPGKRTRSRLLFTASPSPKNIELLVHAAAAVELIHEASIVHDDIQDRTDVRRGNTSVWKEFGANTALLLGDHLVSAAFRAIAEVDTAPGLQGRLFIMLSQAISKAASGQHLQLSADYLSHDLQTTYNNVAISKTGAFIALPLQFSNLLGYEEILDPEPARKCGEQLGFAYQILDDLRPFLDPTTLATDEDMLDRIVTAPVAAMHTLSPDRDPFTALLQQQQLRDSAVELCKSWLSEALLEATQFASQLPEHSGEVITQFIETTFTAHTAENNESPLTTKSSQLLISEGRYKPWRVQGNTSSI
jgi:geranylgeranyl pyrophosphate synthase